MCLGMGLPASDVIMSYTAWNRHSLSTGSSYFQVAPRNKGETFTQWTHLVA